MAQRHLYEADVFTPFIKLNGERVAERMKFLFYRPVQIPYLAQPIVGDRKKHFAFYSFGIGLKCFKKVGVKWDFSVIARF